MARTVPVSSASGALVAESVEEACATLRRGGVVAVPTESFYGLAASVGQDAAVNRLWDIKGRPAGKPILVLIADRAQLAGLVAAVPEGARALMQVFWPGPVTIIFPAAPAVPPSITAGTRTIGVRFSAHPVVRALAMAVGPLTGTSANRSGEKPASTASEVEAALGAEIDLILDGGTMTAEAPSTVVDATGPVRIVRDGQVSAARIAEALRRSDLLLSEEHDKGSEGHGDGNAETHLR